MRIASIMLLPLLFACSRASEPPSLAIVRIKQEFVSSHSARQVLELEPRIQVRTSTPELLDPAATLPHWASLPYPEAQALARYRQSCDPAVIESRTLHFESPALRKALLSYQRLCDAIPSLPQDFFDRAPYLHPSGKSYAALAASFGVKVDPVRFHLLEELNQLLSKDGHALSAWEYAGLLRMQNFVLTDDAVWMRIGGSETTPSRRYALYDRRDWEAAERSMTYVPRVNLRTDRCALEEGNVCWVENEARAQRWTRALIASLSVALVLALAALVRGRVRRSRLQRAEAAQRLFVLQMLTHELRTPLTAIRLSVETLRSDFDQLPERSQKSFLRLTQELQRLNRVVDASKSYLRPPEAGKFLRPETAVPLSINEFVANIVASYESSPVRLEPLERDLSVVLDPYWIELCLRNLIDNALTHGAPPVELRLRTEATDSVAIEVRDQGDYNPKRPRSKRSGLGLGLSLVSRVARELGGELRSQSSPTVFTLVLKRNPEMKEHPCPPS